MCKSGCFFFFSLTFVGRVVLSNIFTSGRCGLLICGLFGLFVTFVVGFILLPSYFLYSQSTNSFHILY